MECPHCHKSLSPTLSLRFCEHCGAEVPPANSVAKAGPPAPPRIAVQVQRLQPDVPNVLFVRCESEGGRVFHDVEVVFTSRGGVQLGDGSCRQMRIRDDAPQQWLLSLQGSSGTHIIDVMVYGEHTRWRGQFHVELAADAPPPALHFTYNPQYAVGDNQFHVPAGLNVNACPTGGEFEAIKLIEVAASEAVTRKQIFQGRTPAMSRRLSLLFREPHEVSRLCLLGGTKFALGRRRDNNDLPLRVPRTSACDEKPSRPISRDHAMIEFREKGAYWCDCSSGGTALITRGSPVRQLDSTNGRTRLQSGMELSPGKVLPLRTTVYRHRESFDGDAYRWLVERHLNAPYDEPIGPDAAVRLERGDELALDEQYLLFQQYVHVGSSPDCAIHLPHISVAPIHAFVLFLAGSFWLEPLTTSFRTLFDGQPVPQDHLLPLAPNNFIQFGDVSITVDDFKQRILDY